MTYASQGNPIAVADLRGRADGDHRVVFRIGVPFDDLLDCDGIAGLNEHLDGCVQGGQGYLLEDIGYKPVGTDGDIVIVEVDADAASFLDGTDDDGEDDELLCQECGRPMVANADGTSNHLFPRGEEPEGASDETGVGPIDHDRDRDHVALADEDE
jgi:hypothetical protein